MKRFACAAFLAACGGASPAPSQPPSSLPDASVEPPVPAPPSAPAPALDAAPAPAPASASAPTTASAPPDSPDAGAGGFDMSVVFAVYKDHKDALTAACWAHSKSTEKAYIGKAAIRLSAAGKVISTKTDGTDEAASACVDKQIKKWKFPPPNGTAAISLPIHMHRD